MDENRLNLLVGGRIYSGWTEVAVKLGIEQIAGTFDISLTERWPDSPVARR